MTELQPHERIIVALDLQDAGEAVELAKRLAPHVGAVKVGLELVNAAGPEVLSRLSGLGLRVFYDAKLHDIPNTVAGAVRAAARHGIWLINVHCPGGSDMMRAAAAAAAEAEQPPQVIGVTVLTSISGDVLHHELGVAEHPVVHVVRLARLAQYSGLAGVVASPQEAAAVREACGAEFVIVTPGVRPAGAAADDQQRVGTPRQAVDEGADYLVIGRPITRADDPVAAAQQIAEELA